MVGAAAVYLGNGPGSFGNIHGDSLDASSAETFHHEDARCRAVCVASIQAGGKMLLPPSLQEATHLRCESSRSSGNKTSSSFLEASRSLLRSSSVLGKNTLITLQISKRAPSLATILVHAGSHCESTRAANKYEVCRRYIVPNTTHTHCV